MIHTIKNEGLAKCIYEPRGDNGLEGYQLGDTYHYQIRESEENGVYYKVYPDKNDMNYGETCSKRTFNKYFKSFLEIEYKPLEEVKK